MKQFACLDLPTGEGRSMILADIGLTGPEVLSSPALSINSGTLPFRYAGRTECHSSIIEACPSVFFILSK
jgi:hypothetical protein